MSIRAVVVVFGLCLLTTGCVGNGDTAGLVDFMMAPSGASYGSGSGYSGNDDSDGPSVHTLSGGFKDALKEGCRNRYATDRRRYQQCVQGDRHSEDALIDGCYSRYSGNGKKLRDCLAHAY